MSTSPETNTPALAREAAIDAACMRMSYGALPAMAVSTSLAAVAVAWVLSAEVAVARLGWWLGTVFLVGVGRVVLFRWIHARPRGDEEVRRILPVFTAVMAAAAATWGALIFVCGLSSSTLVITTIGLAVGGMMAAGAVSTAGTPRIVMTSAALTMGPLAVLMAASGARALLLLVAGHAITVLAALRLNHRNARESIGLRFENRDLVRSLEAEKALELAARREAEQANQEKSRFLAAASHDARQPLHALGLFVDTLKAQELSPRARQLVSSIDLAQGSLVSLHEGLLDLSTLDVGAVEPRPKPVRVRELLRVIESESAPRAKQRGLSLRVSGPDVTVSTDAALALRVLRNLVANALAYTEQGRVLVAVRRRGPRALVQVWDTGIGIAEEEQQRIFDELYQVANPARDRQKGLGLGLSIVRRLAQSLDTEVRVRSRPGKGSVFWFELPLSAQPFAPVELPVSTRGPLSAPGQVLLLVDDDGLAREALDAMLELWGYEVVAAQSAEDALDYAAQLERLDVVVSDLWLPGRSGLELLAELAKARPSLKRVVISGDTEKGTDAKVRASGADFIRKPVRADALSAVLEAAPLAATA